VQADVELSRAVSRSSGSEALLASMDHAQASLKYVVASRLSVGTAYQWRRRESGSGTATPRASALLLSLSYSQDWR
jgi:hypothetical protein